MVTWVVNLNDHDIEANIFTKNLKATVTEKDLLEAYSQIVPIVSLQLINIPPNPNVSYVKLKKNERALKKHAFT